MQVVSIILLSGVCRRLSSSVTLLGGPAGGFTRVGQAMTSCHLQSNYSFTVTLHGGPVALGRHIVAVIVITLTLMDMADGHDALQCLYTQQNQQQLIPCQELPNVISAVA